MARAILDRGKEVRVASGHPWIFRSDIIDVRGNANPGDVVDVVSFKGRFLGKAMFNPKSQITLRLFTHHDEPINRDFFAKRIQQAWNYRKLVADTESCRVIFAESDLLPGLIVDKFSDVLVLQSLALGIERHKDTIVDLLREIVPHRGMYERNDVPVRDLEGLPQEKGFLSEPFDTTVEMRENGIKFLVDVENGQKTGFFLDQKENRAALKPFVKGKTVLDCFTHTGSFALHAAAYEAASVTGIDISDHAVACATQNAQLNGFQNVTFQAENAFDTLRRSADEGITYDTIILDPPAFTKTRSAIEGAVRGYKEINLRAMKMLTSGGFLITCSCSHHISTGHFMEILQSAAIDAKRDIRLVEYRSQAKDHPILLASAETQYIKCAILQVF